MLHCAVITMEIKLAENPTDSVNIKIYISINNV